MNNPNLSGMYNGGRYFQPYKYFYLLNNSVPSKRSFYDINSMALLNGLIENFEIDESAIIRSDYWQDKNYELRSVLVPVEKNLMVYSNPGIDGPEGIEILYDGFINEEKLNKLSAFILNFQKKSQKLSNINLLCFDKYNGLHLRDFEVGKKNLDIDANYNDDLKEIDAIIQQRLNTPKDKGIVFLYGPPGTGKTTYIRYLINNISKKMIYITSDIAEKIGSPDFMTFLINNPDSVLIVEDAENIIEDRGTSRSSVVSNLLNLSDGLLSDCLSIQLICTFNTSLANVDKAFLRKGRVIARYEFTVLNEGKTKRLMEQLGHTSIISSGMTLAEIYNYEDKSFSPQGQKRIGFMS